METIECQACNFANPEGTNFCGRCGVSMDRPCPKCSKPNPSEFAFCGQCGTPLKVDESVSRGTPDTYTPKHLAEKVLNSRGALEGERKRVTILFADVKGSMELAGQLDPERWHDILNRFFEILTEGIHRFEGTVNQYTGDGVMALFGAPIAHEDHVRRACYSALHLQEELNRYSLELRRESGLNFAFRMGINSGDVVVGKIGDDLRMDYTAQGASVGLAQRMEQLAEANAVYLAPDAARQVTGYFDLEDMGEFNVKGSPVPLQVNALRGLGTLRTRLQVSQSRGFSKFVGRADEMSTLEHALNHALDGRGEVVGVVGEAGVGKSRLCHEFIEACRSRDIGIYEAHCPAHGQTIPYLPVFELLRSYFGVNDTDTPEDARKKIAGTLMLLDNSVHDSLPLVLDFLGVADPDSPPLNIEADARQRQLFSFIRQLLYVRSEKEPAVIYIDDLHWIDSVSDAFIAQLIEIIDQTRTLLLLNFRPEYDADWTGKTYYQQLPVVPLGPNAVDELMRELLGDDSSLEGLHPIIQKRTGGNPFFVEEVIQALVESETLAGGRGAYRLTTSVQALQIPDTVRAILAARIDRLAEESKRVLQTAAVIGKEFIEPILQEVIGVSGSDLNATLQSLQSAEFIYEQSLYPIVEYAFKHPLTQEVVLDTQLQERRKLIHGAVARATIAATPDKHDEQAALIAYHFESAGEQLEAARWYRRAAEWIRLTSPMGGIPHWRRVLNITRALELSDEVDTLRLDACKALLNLESWRLGMSIKDVEDLVTEGRLIADKREDNNSIASLETSRISRYWGLGNLRRFVELEVGLRELLGKVNDVEEQISMYVFLAFPRFVRGDLGQALQDIDQVRKLTQGDDFERGAAATGFNTTAWHLGLRPLVAAWTGDLSTALGDIGEAIRVEREMGLTEPLTWAFANRAVVAYLLGLEGSACDSIEREALEGVGLSNELGNRMNQVYSLVGLGIAHLQRGRFEDAVRVLEESISGIEEFDVGVDQEAEAYIVLALAKLGLKEVGGAMAAARQAIKTVDRTGTELWRPWACLALGKCVCAAKDEQLFAEAARVLDDALECAEDHGMHAMTPQLLECKSELAVLQGDEKSAQTLREEALTQYRLINATGHVQRLEASS